MKLREATSVIVQIGPFMDTSDAITPETAITLTGADQAELFKAAASTVTDISGRTWASIVSASGWYRLTLTSGDTDTIGPMRIVVQDSSVCLPVFADFEVIATEIYDALFGSTANGFDASGAVVPATGSITSAKFAASAITSNVLADNAVDSSVLSANAVTKIQAGLATPTNITAGTITTVTSVTTVVGISANAIASAAISADAVSKITASVATSAQAAAIQTSVASVLDDTGTTGVIVNAMTSAALADFFNVAALDISAAVASSVVSEIVANAGGASLTESGIADAVWNELTSTHVVAGSTGSFLASAATSAGVAALNNISTADVSTAALSALTQYDPPTSAEVAARTILASAYATSSAIAAGVSVNAMTSAALADFFEVSAVDISAAVASSVVSEIVANAQATLGASSITSATFSANAITSAAISADAVSKITAAVATSAQVAGLNDIAAGDVSTAALSAITAYDPPTSAEVAPSLIADTVFEELISTHVSAGTFGSYVASAATSAQVAGLNDISTADVSGAAMSANTAYDAPTSAELAARTIVASAYATSADVAGLNNISAADVSTAALSAVTAFDPPTSAELATRTLPTASYATSAALATVDANVDLLTSAIISAAVTSTVAATVSTCATNLSGFADGQMTGRELLFLTGNAAGEATDCTNYTSANGLLTFTSLTTAPGTGDLIKIV